MKIYHAWYSRQAAILFGSMIYARADGTEVEITTASEDFHFNYGWPDKQYRGVVVNYIRPGQSVEKNNKFKGLTFFKKSLTLSPQ